MQIEIQETQLKIGAEVFPRVGFGTYPLKGDTCERSVRMAFETGYRCFDTATMYDNFEAIANVLKDIQRAEIFLTSKVWPSHQAGQKLLNDLDLSLKTLKMDYLDVYLLHWPDSRLNFTEIVDNMNGLIEQQKVRFVGLSNVTVHHLKKALEQGMPVSVVQIEMNPGFYDPELLQLCHQENILVQTWSPLGRGKVIQNKLLMALSQKYNKMPSQIALRWILQHQCLPIPSSTNFEHIQSNLDVFDFELSAEDFEAINQIAKNGTRFRITEAMGMGFTDEFDFPYEKCWPSES
jgi:diketogulonate reductase-like aldo/keto reductase